jgi:hypothetical protein
MYVHVKCQQESWERFFRGKKARQPAKDKPLPSIARGNYYYEDILSFIMSPGFRL